MKDQQIKTCPVCGKELHGRSDKTYCSMTCKNYAHNTNSNSFRSYRNRVMTSLTQNYKILSSLIEESIDSVEITDLEAAGFKRSYVTGYEPQNCTRKRCRCFDIVYEQTESRISKIEKKTL